MLAACATGRFGGSDEATVLDRKDLPPPTQFDMAAASRPYLIGPFDKLNIDVFGVPDLQKEVQADASGQFSFPLIGIVEASGRTPASIETEVERRLSRFVKDPQVNVNLVETVSQVITVEGEVDKPGLYPVLGNMTLVRAVATAGGVGEYANLGNVVVFRNVNGKRYAALYNLKAIRRGNYPDPDIYPNDVIIVSESTAKRLFRSFLQIAPLMSTPLIILTRN